MPDRPVKWSDRYTAWRARRVPACEGFVLEPEPRTLGSYARGRQLLEGRFLFAGELVEAQETALWDLPMPHVAFERALHGYRWLDDLASLGDAEARELGQNWFDIWARRHLVGRGLGWLPHLVARRVIRLINHSDFLLRGASPELKELFYKSLAQHGAFLERTWSKVPEGPRRFEALVGTIQAGVYLKGFDAPLAAVTQALAKDCDRMIDQNGGIASRNPESLLELFEILGWAAESLKTAEHPVPAGLSDALARIAPTLRALRHADGGLARFHGGARGADGRLDQALLTSGVRTPRRAGLVMGFHRLQAGRTTLIADSAAPPTGPGSEMAHASTLAFEVTSGRRPLIVNCGPGGAFGMRWARAGRATPSHSTLSIDGVSSAQLSDVGEMLEKGPRSVQHEVLTNEDGTVWEAAHDGYGASHGLTHIRRIEMSNDGRSIDGTDTLTTLSDEDKRIYDKSLTREKMRTVPYSVRWHLHPDVRASLDMGGSAVSLELKSGELWVFRHDGQFMLRLEPSVYLQKGTLEPRPSQQIVLLGRAMSYATRIRWSLAKAQDTPIALRDVEERDFNTDGADVDAT